MITVVVLIVLLIRQNNTIVSLKYENEIFRNVLNSLDLGFCFVDLQMRSETIFFKGIHSLNCLYDIFENGNKLQECYSSASSVPNSTSITLKIRGNSRYVECKIESVLDKNNDNAIITGVMLIFEDVSESVYLNTKAKTQTKHMIKNNLYYMSILDNTPYLIWEFDNNVGIKYANKKYLGLFGKECININQSGISYKRLSVNNTIRIFSIYSINNQGSVINFAHDVTELVQAQKEIERFYNIRKNIFYHLNTPIAFHGKDTRLKLYNNAFVKIFSINRKWLNTQPLYLAMWERLCEDEKIVENNLFFSVELFKSVTDAFNDVIYLSDGRCIHVTIIPELDKGVWFIYELIK